MRIRTMLLISVAALSFAGFASAASAQCYGGQYVDQNGVRGGTCSSSFRPDNVGNYYGYGYRGDAKEAFHYALEDGAFALGAGVIQGALNHFSHPASQQAAQPPQPGVAYYGNPGYPPRRQPYTHYQPLPGGKVLVTLCNAPTVADPSGNSCQTQVMESAY
jgi:hypothetical protein